ncbi:TonB-dependent receptor plug domain-containing protein [Novosphingobium album (ex Liu et al. 2023)]|uniref:TonB-dependent receptor n=1 Tax=Novosphingobium album (ex Liu et al. 2023) TaxID=3031130 RepID=A0ABT5WMY2_9SPHN|nr:TonB-dependent receptor [Novosphingobium album (ex Liu et al. 2023)]MDE8651399.1 TonB-dependent receptor [Novosphingobium album (ex Liu et al. 2023)]
MKYLFYLCSALAVATPVLAQGSADEVLIADRRIDDTAITVVATGSRLDVGETGQSVSVIGADEIASVQGPDIARVLERLPGVTLARNGGLGGVTSLFVRGANSQQVLVLVDGIRVADVAAPGAGYDFGNLAAGPIAKIELLRGSNSVVWGSEAIGGVLALTSREVNGIEGAAEYGARDSFDGQVNAGLAGDGYGVTLNTGYTRTDGISQAASGTEKDGFRQWRAGGRAHVDLMPGLTASLVGRYTDGKLAIDGYPAPLYSFADTPEYQKTREVGGRAGLAWAGDAISLDAGFQVSDTRRRYYDPTYSDTFTSENHGQSRRAELNGVWRATDALRLDFGADHEWSRIDVAGDSRRKANLSSGHALLGWYGEALSLAAGVRYDDHSRFGGEWTFGANGSVTIAPRLRVRASYGEGFKAPTLYQLYSDYGDTALAPERSRSYDAGIEYGARGEGLHLALTGFRRDSRNLIDFVSCTGAVCDTRPYGLYANVGRARAQGVEVELGAQVSPRLRAQAAYTYVKATNRTEGDVNEGNALARRPRHAVTVSADWTTPLAGLVLGADIRMAGDSYDDMGNFTRLDGYATGTLRASLPIGEKFELFGRVENVTDESYATVSGYGTPGRSAFVGVRARM